MFYSNDHETPMKSAPRMFEGVCNYKFGYCLPNDVKCKIVSIDSTHALLVFPMDGWPEDIKYFVLDGTLAELIDENLEKLGANKEWKWINDGCDHYRWNGWSLSRIYMFPRPLKHIVTKDELLDAKVCLLEAQLVPVTQTL